MDQYPFGNFRDNPPLPLYVWNQPSFFNPQAHRHAIPYVMSPGFHHHQVDNPYLPYTVIPVFPADPFTSNFSYPPPLPRIQIPAHIDLHGRTFNPPLTSKPNEYFLLQTPSNQSNLSSPHPLIGPDALGRQSSRNELSKECSVQEKRPILKQDQSISEFQNTRCANTTIINSEDHDDLYNFQEQPQEQEQQMPLAIQDLSEQLHKQLILSGQHSTVKYGDSVTLQMNMTNSESSVNEGDQTMSQDEIQVEYTGFLRKQTVITGENAIQPYPGAPQTTEPISMYKQSQVHGQPGLTHTISQEQETCTVQQEPPAIQQEPILNKDQDEQHAQSHQNNINPEKIQQTLDQFHQNKKEDKQRLQNSIKRSKSRRRNWEYHRHQPRRQHEETPLWQQCSYWPPQYHHQFQQSYQNATSRGRFSQDSYQPVGTPRTFMDARFDRRGNSHNKASETRSSKAGKNKNPQEGNSSDDQRATNSRSEVSRIYINRQHKSMS